MTSSPFLNGDARQRFRTCDQELGKFIVNVLTIFGSAMSALVVILFVYLIYLTGGVGLDRESFLRGVSMIRCPRCQSEGIRRSKRKGFVECGPLTLVFLKPFRCKHCERRFFRWPINFNGHSDTPGSPKKLATAKVR
jgi:hypothetical protein